MRPDERANAQRTSAFWDALVTGQTVDAAGQEEDLIHRLHHQDDTPRVSPTFASRLGSQLMLSAPRLAREAARGRKAANMYTIPTSRPILGKSAPRRRMLSIPTWFPSAAMVLIVVTLIGATFGSHFNSSLNHEPKRQQLAALNPSPEAAPQSTPQTGPIYTENGGTYRGTAARNGVNPGPVPIGKLSVAWTYDEILGARDVMYEDGKIYVFTLSLEQENILLCLIAETGQPCWNKPIVIPGQKIDYVYPVVANGYMFLITSYYVSENNAWNSLLVLSLDTGSVNWEKKIDQMMNVESMAVGDSTVFVLVDREILAFDARTGNELWRNDKIGVPEDPGYGGALHQLAYDDGILVATGLGASIAALDVRSGQILWSRTDEDSYSSQNGPVISDGVVFYSTAQGPFDGTLHPVEVYAIDIRTGQSLWQPKLIEAEVTLAAANGTLFVADEWQFSSEIRAYDVATGDEKWFFEGGGRFRDPVIVNDQLVVFSAGDGTLQGFDVKTGKSLWGVYLGLSQDILVADSLILSSGPWSLVALSGNNDADTATVKAPYPDLSGLPGCVPPRIAPSAVVPGEPSLSIPEETKYFDDASLTTPEQDDAVAPNWLKPQILNENLPDITQASPEVTVEIQKALLAQAECAQLPDSRYDLPAFYSDDYFRRGYTTFIEEGQVAITDSGWTTAKQSGYFVWPPFGVSDVADGRLIFGQLADGRIAVWGGESQGYGTLLIFQKVDDQWLIDEEYRILPEYDDYTRG